MGQRWNYRSQLESMESHPKAADDQEYAAQYVQHHKYNEQSMAQIGNALGITTLNLSSKILKM